MELRKGMTQRLIALWLAGGAAGAHADFKMMGPVEATDGIRGWQQTLDANMRALKDAGQYPASGYSECRETREVPGAFLCQSDTPLTMNLAFVRASLYVEGDFGVPHGTVVRQDDPAFQKALRRVAGNDLPGADLREFESAARMACQTDSARCLNAQETEMYRDVVGPLAQSTKPFVVISFGRKSFLTYNGVVSHETMHAQYFLQPAYRSVADDFWKNQMTEDQRMEIRNALSGVYDAKNELLMRNEFQAYMLMADAKSAHLGRYVSLYRGPLMDAMTKAGVIPVQVHRFEFD